MDKTYKVEEYQKALKNLLREIIQVFDKEKIVYFAVTGTCLGAVRHGDIIPWDDDIDIAVFRKDYEKALHIIRENCNNLYVWDWSCDEKCDIPCARIFRKIIEGGSRYENSAFIDVAPIDNAPNSALGRLGVAFFSIVIRRLINRKSKTCLKYKTWTISSIIFYWAGVIFSLLPIRTLKKLYLWIIVREQFSSIAWFPTIGRKFASPSKCFSHACTAQFGDMVLPIPCETDIYLQSLYGKDWRVPLQEDKRSGHTFGENWEWKVTKPMDELRMM